jgi:hypothetical protein
LRIMVGASPCGQEKKASSVCLLLVWHQLRELRPVDPIEKARSSIYFCT